MRKLMWFSLGFGLSCALWSYGLKVSIWIFLALLLVSIPVSRRWERLKSGMLLALGCTAGVIWFGIFSSWYLSDAALLDGSVVQSHIQITDYSYETGYGFGADGILSLEGKSYQVRVYVNEDRKLEPGDTVTGTFRFRLTIPGSREEATYHSGKGIFLLAYQRGEATFGRAESENWRCGISRLRQSIRELLADCFPERTLGFVQALLIGDSSLLDYETDVNFRVSGVRHVIAVSGLHVSILFTLLGMLTFRRRFLMAIIGFPALALFAAAAGFAPSVNRAVIMCALMLLSLLLEKEYDGPTALSFAVLCMLVSNPLVITAAGFQLSVCSVAGIYLFYEPLNSRLMSLGKKEKGRTLPGRLKKWLCGSIAMTLSVTVTTVPLCAWYFGTVSLIAAVTNLLVLWIITPVFCGIMAVCGLGLLWKPGAILLARVLAVPVDYILWITKWLAKFPLASVYTESIYIVIWLILSYLLLGVFLLRKRKRPELLLGGITVLLCTALLLSWYAPGDQKSGITMLDVGQGQCILLHSEGRTFLVDCGGDSDKDAAELAVRTLLSRGIRSLDGVILTHYDRDHMGGLPYLLTRIGTPLLILPDTEDRGRGQLLPVEDAEVAAVSDTLTVEYGDTRLTVFGPIYYGYSNENSLCILFETENCDILITGDRSAYGERMLLRQYALPDVDILVAGHHGAGDSTSDQLLDAVTPETVLISVSETNHYGHPSEDLLWRLEARGCTIYRTDERGTITIRR
ncbi:MAG: DNA internalization-related competence protein ComEC/Rec2 [Oscillospiraceae bacterium]|nr:DNA internalization-related competence protein ComEC/Rec2 [Oscillospiraceae bacterium]